jgi:hypothetical protein
MYTTKTQNRHHPCAEDSFVTSFTQNKTLRDPIAMNVKTSNMKLATVIIFLASQVTAFQAPLAGFRSTIGLQAASTKESETATETSTKISAKEISGLTKSVETIFTTEQIDEFLPHRYPFALVDKVVAYEAGKSAVGIKCVTKNEEFFNGHFPGRPYVSADNYHLNSFLFVRRLTMLSLFKYFPESCLVCCRSKLLRS